MPVRLGHGCLVVCCDDVMLQAAGANEEQLEMLKMSGLIQEGKLADAAKLSKYDACVLLIVNELFFLMSLMESFLELHHRT